MRRRDVAALLAGIATVAVGFAIISAAATTPDTSGGGAGANPSAVSSGVGACPGGTCTFGPGGNQIHTGLDGTTQYSIGYTAGAAEYWQALGGIAGSGGTFYARNASGTGNVNGHFTAQGAGYVDFGNNADGVLARAVDPGGTVIDTVKMTPSANSGPVKVGGSANGTNVDCGSAGVCQAGGSTIATAANLYNLHALNVNGDFQIDQVNEGASITPSATPTLVIDGWRAVETLNSKFSYQQKTSIFAGYQYAELITNVAGATSPGATDLINFLTQVTGPDAAFLQWGTASAKAATLDVCLQGNASITYPATVPLYVNNNDGGGTYETLVHLVTLTAASTPACSSISIPAPTAGSLAQTFGNVSIQAGVSLCSGTTYQTSTLDSWQAARYYSSSGATNLCAVSGAAIYVSAVHLHPGPVELAYQPLPYAVELDRARKRYWKTFSPGTKPVQNAGANTGEIQFDAEIATTGTERSPRVFFPHQMDASALTVTYFNPSAAAATCQDETAAGATGTPATVNATANGFSFTASGNASTAVGNLIGCHVTVDSGL